MKRKLLIFAALLLVLLVAVSRERQEVNSTKSLQKGYWPVQSIDTMKFSRDIAREKLSVPSYVIEIDQQVKNIQEAGATHVAVATPYDEEFIPYLTVWVKSARAHGLKVWFRGNFSGWEGWFEYPKIGRNEHIEKLKKFLSDHQDLFMTGDIFSPCPECENGGPGDPRFTRDVSGHRAFLIQEHEIAQSIFKDAGKTIQTGFASMNGDVARLIMDKDTTQKLGGFVTVDHYVKTPEQLDRDITEYARQSGGKVVLGEWGAPIPDIHGALTEEEQAAWIRSANELFLKNPHLYGLNYWTHIGSSTELWTLQGKPRTVLNEIKKAYQLMRVSGIVTDIVNNPISDATVRSSIRQTKSTTEGEYSLTFSPDDPTLEVSKDGFVTGIFVIDDNAAPLRIILEKRSQSLWEKLTMTLFSFLKAP